MEGWLIFWYGISSFLLGALLFLPTRKFILAISINRFQRKYQRVIADEELMRLRRRASFITAILTMTFAFIYNRVIMFRYFVGSG
jgi:hypothetical protein